MTNEQINWAITEATGADPHWKCARDYCNDLNAMHEALMTLKDYSMRKYYTQMLEGVVDEPLRFHAIASTARQRAEAFLRALGKWEEATK